MADVGLISAFDQLIGQPVTDRQLAGNSLSVWIAKHPSDPHTGWTIWLEPSWQLVIADRLVAGSMQAQDEEEPDGWDAVSHAVDQLVGRTIESLAADRATGALHIALSGEAHLRTFTSDPREVLLWRITDFADRTALVAGAQGMHLEQAT